MSVVVHLLLFNGSLFCTTSGIGIGGGGVCKKFNVKDFYVMGKALSGELSCPCDRSCFNKKYWHTSDINV